MLTWFWVCGDEFRWTNVHAFRRSWKTDSHNHRLMYRQILLRANGQRAAGGTTRKHVAFAVDSSTAEAKHYAQNELTIRTKYYVWRRTKINTITERNYLYGKNLTAWHTHDSYLSIMIRDKLIQRWQPSDSSAAAQPGSLLHDASSYDYALSYPGSSTRNHVL